MHLTKIPTFVERCKKEFDDRFASDKAIYRTIAIVSTVMIWFFFQGNGCESLARSESELLFGRFCDNTAFCLGGIGGSIVFFLDDSIPFSFKKDRDIATRVGLIVLFSAISFACTLHHEFIPATVFRTATSAAITFVFLESCLLFVGRPRRSILQTFLLVALCRIVQSAIMLVPLSGFGETVLLASALYALLFPYAYAAKQIASDSESLEKNAEEATDGSPDNSTPPSSAEEISDDATDLGETERKNARLPWQFILHVALFYFSMNIIPLWEVRLLPDGWISGLPRSLSSIASFLLFYGVFVRKNDTSEYWARMRQITFPLVFLAFLLIGHPHPETYFLAVLMIQSAYRFFLLSSYAEMFSICNITKIRARRVFAVVHIALYSGMLLGSFYGLFVQRYATENIDAVLFTAGLVFLCLIIASCWLGTDKQAAKVWGRRVKMTPQGKQNKQDKKKCRAVAKAFQLTTKEEETLLLLVKNKSTATIADELFVSKNTVRTHIRNLYNKLDVHSREEVIRFFNEYRG